MDLSTLSGTAEEAPVTPPNIFDDFLEGLRGELVSEGTVGREGEGEGEGEEGGGSVVRGDVRGEGRMEDDVMGEGGGGGRGEEGVRTQPGEVEVSDSMVEVTRCGLGGSSEEALELRDMSPMLQQYLLSLTPHAPPLDK